LAAVTQLIALALCHRCTAYLSGALYRLVYIDSYTDDYVVLRAKRIRDQKKYDVFEQNCEHSATWCKTGIHDGTQMEACFTTLGKVALIVFLRLLSLIVLWLLQLTQQRDGRSRDLERIISVVYVVAIGCVFFVYSLYFTCRGIRTTASDGRHDTDVCGIEAARSRCADAIYCTPCCDADHWKLLCNATAMGLCCISCCCCSLFDACLSLCRKNIECGRGTICRRPSLVVIGLSVRIFLREAIAAAGPLLVVYFENEIVSRTASTVERVFIIIAAIIGASLVAYLIGAAIGVWVEASIYACAKRCCDCGHPDAVPANVVLFVKDADQEARI